MAEKPRSIVDDGFARPFKPLTIGAGSSDENLDAGRHHQPESGTENDKREANSTARLGGFEIVSPNDISSSGTRGDGFGSDRPGNRRRGRPPGSKNRTQETKTSSDLASNPFLLDIESLLMSGHFMLSKLIDIEELELDETEAKKLSDSIQKVAKFYAVSIDPKKMAIAELSMTALSIYGPRGIAYYRRVNGKNAQPQPQPQPQPAAPAPGPRVVPQNQPRANGAPQVPSEMWNQAPIDNDDL